MTDDRAAADREEVLAFLRTCKPGCAFTVEQLHDWCHMPRKIPKARVNEIMQKLKAEGTIGVELVDKGMRLYRLTLLEGVKEVV